MPKLKAVHSEIKKTFRLTTQTRELCDQVNSVQNIYIFLFKFIFVCVLVQAPRQPLKHFPA